MSSKDFYGYKYDELKLLEKHLDEIIAGYEPYNKNDDEKAIVHISSRIKSVDSVIGKLRKKNLTENVDTALKELHDIVGARVVCAFVDDVYKIKQYLTNCPDIEIIAEKDYIHNPKENGYRSLHLIVEVLKGDGKGLTAEIQIRTLAMDFWSSLEHKIKYKKSLGANEKEIQSALRDCANSIASIDLSMLSIKERANRG